MIIAAAERAGTSLLVKILSACGLDTELNRGNSSLWSEPANAGIETLPLAGRELPYVLNSPWTCQFLEELLCQKDVRIDGLIVPIRDLREAAASRIIIELQNKLRSDPDLDDLLAGWRDWALTPGGVTYSLEPIDQARILGQSLHLLLEKALEYEIPICLIKFPKFARDPMYLYRSLKGFLSSEVDSAQFEAIFRSTVSPEQIRVSSELEEPPDSQAATSTVAGAGAQLPSLEGLENVALKRELRAKRVEIAQASTEIGALTARCTDLEAELAAASSKAGLLQSQQVETVDACVAAHAVNCCLPSRIEHQTLTFQPRTFSEIFLNHSRYLSDKWAQFLPIYDFELHPLVARGQPLRLLEIGVQNGGSLQIWHNYLPEGSRIYGLDIDERCRRLDFPPQVKVLIGDAGDPATLNELLGDEVFDIIIDDGSHQSRDVVAAVEALLPRLAAGESILSKIFIPVIGRHMEVASARRFSL